MYDNLNYLEYENDNLFDSYGNKCVSTISNLSRQVRSLMNYRAALIYHRLQSIELNIDNRAYSKFQINKSKFESLALRFIKLSRKLPFCEDQYHDILKFRKMHYSSVLRDITHLTNQIFILMHYFSEKNMLLRSLFFKVLMRIAQETCKTRMYLIKGQYEFYEELCKNYKSMEKDVSSQILNPIQQKPVKEKEGAIIRL